MAKRFYESKLFQEQFFKGSSTVTKLFYLYCWYECDNAGLWSGEFDVAELRLGTKLDKKKILSELGYRLFELPDGKYFVPDFFLVNYGMVKESVNAQKSVIKLLRPYNVLLDSGTLNEQFMNSCLTVQDKDKDKDMDMDKDMDTRTVRPEKAKIPPEISEVIEYMKSKNILSPEANAQKWYDHYNAKGWVIGKSKMVNWKSAVGTWDLPKGVLIPAKEGRDDSW